MSSLRCICLGKHTRHCSTSVARKKRRTKEEDSWGSGGGRLRVMAAAWRGLGGGGGVLVAVVLALMKTQHPIIPKFLSPHQQKSTLCCWPFCGILNENGNEMSLAPPPSARQLQKKKKKKKHEENNNVTTLVHRIRVSQDADVPYTHSLFFREGRGAVLMNETRHRDSLLHHKARRGGKLLTYREVMQISGKVIRCIYCCLLPWNDTLCTPG